MSSLDRMFKLTENNTTVRTEIRAGVVTFLTMSYIIFVQPIILSKTGLSLQSIFIATCVASAIATLLTAILSNYPVAQAPAMGHNVLFQMFCLSGLISWQTGLGAIFISGSIFVILSLWGVREKIMNAIPDPIKYAIAVGIGLLIAFLGFQWAGLVVGIKDPPYVTRGDLHATPVLLSLGGLVLTAALIALRLRGAILIGILVTALAGIPLGVTPTADIGKRGLISLPYVEPMKTVAILPQYTPGDAPPDLPSLAAALDAAADRHYEEGKTLHEPDARKLLQKAGVTLNAKTSAAELSTLAAKALGCDLVIFPVVEEQEAPKGAAAGRPRHATSDTTEKAFIFRAVAAQAHAKQGEEVWRTYHPLPAACAPTALDHYAKDVILGLPGHNGLFGLDILGALRIGLVQVIFVFFFLDMFDAMGTLIGVAQQAGLLRDGRLPRARGALLADALGTVVGAVAGTSTVSSYIESSAGVAEGGRTGLASVATAVLLLLSLFFAPVVAMIGSGCGTLYPAVAPVLIIIGSIMLGNVVHIRWNDPTEALPAFLAIMVMPLTLSITDGIAFGFISYSFLKLITGRGRQVHWLLYLFSVLFIVRYILTKC